MSEINIENYIKTFYNFGADIDGDRLTAEKSTIESALKLQEIVKANAELNYDLDAKEMWKSLIDDSEK